MPELLARSPGVHDGHVVQRRRADGQVHHVLVAAGRHEDARRRDRVHHGWRRHGGGLQRGHAGLAPGNGAAEELKLGVGRARVDVGQLELESDVVVAMSSELPGTRLRQTPLAPKVTERDEMLLSVNVCIFEWYFT